MISADLYNQLLWGWMVLGLVSFFFLLRQRQPYGRHIAPGWGPVIPNQIGWMIMEGVAPVFISFWYWTGSLEKTMASHFFYGIYVLHYVYRSFIFPFRTHTQGKKIPLVISGSAVFFNFCNTFVLGYYLGNLGGNYSNEYFFSFRFLLGISIMLAGFFINFKSDNILIGLRKPGETGYKVPKGFLFSYLSCPNHFGEIMEWFGFALMLGNLAGWSFALWTFVNLVPRAMDHHRWYQQQFADYPKERRAVIPYIL